MEDFSDLKGFGQVIRLAVRLLLAAILGGVLGFERERSGRSAGLRTHMLVALGAALFVLVPQQSEMALVDMSRVIQGGGRLQSSTLLRDSGQPMGTTCPITVNPLHTGVTQLVGYVDLQRTSLPPYAPPPWMDSTGYLLTATPFRLKRFSTRPVTRWSACQCPPWHRRDDSRERSSPGRWQDGRAKQE